MTERVLRVVLPVSTIDRIDGAVAKRLGGFISRNDLIREAVDAYLTELAYGPPLSEGVLVRDAIDSLATSQPGTGEAPLSLTARASAEHAEAENTELHIPRNTAAPIRGVAEIESGPLFGLHNRDYPSLWAAAQIVDLTAHQPIPYEEGVKTVLKRAWSLGAQLKRLDEGAAVKPSAMFPTNRKKPDSAGGAFRTFAIGSYTRNGTIKASGPLFLWGICQLAEHKSKVCIGVTELGYDLLQRLDGISAVMPHGSEHTRVFLAHLREHAKDDYWGFSTIVSLVESNPSRDELLSRFRERQPNWSNAQVASYASGYLSRGREWGLIDPKRVEGRYTLSELGREWLSQNGSI